MGTLVLVGSVRIQSSKPRKGRSSFLLYVGRGRRSCTSYYAYLVLLQVAILRRLRQTRQQLEHKHPHDISETSQKSMRPCVCEPRAQRATIREDGLTEIFCIIYIYIIWILILVRCMCIRVLILKSSKVYKYIQQRIY